MTEGPSPSLDEVLRRLGSIDGVEAVAVARADGLVVSHHLPNWVDPNQMAAMAAVLVGAGSQVAKALRRGGLVQCLLRCEEGRIIAHSTPGSTILMTLLSEGANMGLVLTALETAAEEVGEALATLLASGVPQVHHVRPPA